MYTRIQWGQTLIESIKAKAAYEQMVATFGIRVKKLQTGNGIFAEEDFKSDVSDNNYTIIYYRFGAHSQNGIAEAAIKQLTEKARTMLIHTKHLWPEVIQPCLWPLALKQAEFNLDKLRLGKSGKSCAKILVLYTTKSTSGIIIRSVAWCTYLMHNFKVPVLFRNGTSEWEWAHTLEDTQFTQETFP